MKVGLRNGKNAIDNNLSFLYTKNEVYSCIYNKTRRKPMNGIISQTGNDYMLKTNVRRWGNSQGIRLPKELMSQMNLKENDAIGICVKDGKMMIEKLNNQKYPSLKERLEDFYKKPVDEIFVESAQEVDAGSPVGDEIW